MDAHRNLNAVKPILDMKKAAMLLMLPMLIVPVAAFCQSKQIEIIAVEHHDAHDDEDHEILDKQDLFAYDSVTFSDK